MYPLGAYSSLIEQLRKLQGMVKMSTMKASTTSTCVMVNLLTLLTSYCPHIKCQGLRHAAVLFPHSLLGIAFQVFLLSFCLIIFPSVNPFGGNKEQKELYTPSSSKLPQNKKSVLCYIPTFLAMSFFSVYEQTAPHHLNKFD